MASGDIHSSAFENPEDQLRGAGFSQDFGVPVEAASGIAEQGFESEVHVLLDVAMK